MHDSESRDQLGMTKIVRELGGAGQGGRTTLGRVQRWGLARDATLNPALKIDVSLRSRV
jgi:hypothetical protein